MKNEKIEIYKSLKTNNVTVKIVVFTSFLAVAMSLLLVYVLDSKKDRYVYGLSKDKSLLPLELIEVEEEKLTFQKSHVAHFLTLFYTIDQYNYKQQIEKALWLVDDSGPKLFQEYTQLGHYNTMIRSSSNQYVDNVEVVFEENNFRASGLIVISTPKQEEPRTYKIVVEGSLKKVKRNYPKNPYGYIIYNYREISKTEITE